MLAARHAGKIDTASACMTFMITLRLCIVVVGTRPIEIFSPFLWVPATEMRCVRLHVQRLSRGCPLRVRYWGKMDVTRTSNSYSTLRFDLRMISPQRPISDLM